MPGPETVRVTLPPAQKVVGPPAEIVGDGAGLTVTLTGDELPLQPLGSVTFTLKLPLALTTIDCVVAPFDHR